MESESLKQLEVLNVQTLEQLGYGSEDELFEKVEAGVFPPPCDAGHGTPVWTRQQVESWLWTRPVLKRSTE